MQFLSIFLKPSARFEHTIYCTSGCIPRFPPDWRGLSRKLYGTSSAGEAKQREQRKRGYPLPGVRGKGNCYRRIWRPHEKDGLPEVRICLDHDVRGEGGEMTDRQLIERQNELHSLKGAIAMVEGIGMVAMANDLRHLLWRMQGEFLAMKRSVS